MTDRRLRSILVDNTIGKIYTNVADTTSVTPVNLIAGSVLKTVSKPQPIMSSNIIKANNLGLAGIGPFASVGLITLVTLTAATAPTGLGLVSNGGDVSIVLKQGTTYSTSVIVGTYSLLATFRNTPTVASISLAVGDYIYVDIIKVGDKTPGKGLTVQLGYYLS